MYVITLLNEKGGVGKTTLATHIAAGLSIRGQRVVLVDADSQAHSTVMLGLEKANGLYELLVHYAEWKQVLKAPPYPHWAPLKGAPKGSLYVLPSNMETRVIPMLVSDATLLRERLNELRGWVDTVVIDTSPTPSMLHTQVYMATDYLIHPTKCEYLSLDALNETSIHIETLQSNRSLFNLPVADVLGIQPVMTDTRTNAHDYGIDLLAGKFNSQIWPEIAKRTAWRDAAFAKKTLFAHHPHHKATTEAWSLVDRVQEGIAA